MNGQASCSHAEGERHPYVPAHRFRGAGGDKRSVAVPQENPGQVIKS